MAITVKDIREKEFNTEMRGYTRDEVDDFLDELADQTEELGEENQKMSEEIESLKAQIASLKKQLGEANAAREQAEQTALAAQNAPVKVEKDPTFNEPQYFKNLETTLRETLITAQRIADETIEDSRKQASRIVAEAEDKAAKLEEQSQIKLTQARNDYEQIRTAGEEYHKSFTQLIEQQAQLLKDSALNADK